MLQKYKNKFKYKTNFYRLFCLFIYFALLFNDNILINSII